MFLLLHITMIICYDQLLLLSLLFQLTTVIIAQNHYNISHFQLSLSLVTIIINDSLTVHAVSLNVLGIVIIIMTLLISIINVITLIGCY